MEQSKTVPGLRLLILKVELPTPRDITPHTVGYVLATLGLARFNQWLALRRQETNGATKVVDSAWL